MTEIKKHRNTKQRNEETEIQNFVFGFLFLNLWKMGCCFLCGKSFDFCDGVQLVLRWSYRSNSNCLNSSEVFCSEACLQQEKQKYPSCKKCLHSFKNELMGDTCFSCKEDDELVESIQTIDSEKQIIIKEYEALDAERKLLSEKIERLADKQQHLDALNADILNEVRVSSITLIILF